MSAIQWLAPRPLWADFAGPASRAAFRRPALLRFAKDTFMEDLQTLLTNRSGDLRKYVARPESWREPAAGLPAPGTSTTAVIGAPPARFRLYQPLHQRFYLLSAALACRLPGLPDHTVKPDEAESIGFVIRRVDPLTTSSTAVFSSATRQEFAWIDGERPGWRPLSSAGLAEGEQEIALFPMAYGENGSRRRMLAGLIPVGRRQEYVSGRTLPPLSATGLTPAAPGDDPRIIDLQRTLIDPWAEQIDLFEHKLSVADKANPDILFSLDLGAGLILLDFLNFLLEQAPAVGAKIVDPSALSPTGAGLTLYNTLISTMVTNQDTSGLVSLAEAMRKAKQSEPVFESATLQTNTTPTLPGGYPRVSLLQNTALPLMNKNSEDVRAIQLLVAPALTTPMSDSPPRIPAKDPVSPVGNVWFVARCFYKRPQCGPNSRVILSDPTEPFQLASIFDPDAPARMSQVALPLDTTPAGLRKHDKSVAFMVSDELSKQMARIKGLKELTEGDVGGPGIGLGFICSLSIPIITLCAFIVLFIFVILLNIIFGWMAFFKICFPIPMPAKGDA